MTTEGRDDEHMCYIIRVLAGARANSLTRESRVRVEEHAEDNTARIILRPRPRRARS